MRKLTVLGIGAAVMYFFDPQLGRRRRSLVRDKANRFVHEIQNAAEVVQRDFNNRLQGLEAMLRPPARREPASDDVIAARVRSKLGRLTSHPHAIEVAVHEGIATLRGPILANEAARTLAAIEWVPGVKRVINELQPHQKRDIAALQGGRPRHGELPNILQESWSPTTRLVVGAAGAGLVLYGSLRRAPLTCFLGSAGLALLAGESANASARHSHDHRASQPLPAQGGGRQSKLREQPSHDAEPGSDSNAAAAAHGK